MTADAADPSPHDATSTHIHDTLRAALNAVHGTRRIHTLGREAGVSAAAIYNIRAGKTAPNLKVTARLLRALGYTLTLEKAGT